MAETKKLADDELEKVSGGASVTVDGVTYKDGDVYVSTSTKDLSSMWLTVYVLTNCGPNRCDLDQYMYNQQTKEFVYLCQNGTGYLYGNLYPTYIRLGDITLK